MTVPRRLSAFAALLVAVLAAAAAAGGAIGPDRESAAPAGGGRPMDDGHGGEMPVAAATTAAVPGLAVSQDGLRLELATTSFPRAREGRLRLRITGPDGRPVRDFDVQHEKRLHLIVVRRDTQGFQHLHPTMAPDGTWSTPLRLDDAGSYRVFADFTTKGRKHTLGADLMVDGDATYRALPAAADTALTDDGYEVRLDRGGVRAGRESDLRFTVLRGGRAVATEPYLGAGGHLVALREGDLAYLHTHPDEHGADDGSGHADAVDFMTTLPTAGRYRLFFQFRHGGRIHTAAFTMEVAR